MARALAISAEYDDREQARARARERGTRCGDGGGED